MTVLPNLPNLPNLLGPIGIPAARDPGRSRSAARLLVVDPAANALVAAAPTHLVNLLMPGDLLVVNDAATLPASLRIDEGGELRLLARVDDGVWQAVRLGAGDWRDDTDVRPAPAPVVTGATLRLAGGLTAEVIAVDPHTDRLVTVRFDRTGSALASALYAVGRPVQYSYMAGPVPLEAVQNVYAGRPWAVEMPSAGRMLTWAVLDALQAHGVRVATLTHSAGLSATGNASLDRRLPLPERYEIPTATSALVRDTHASGGRVIAAGTSVVRALEGDALAGSPGAGVTSLRLGPDSRLTQVDGLLSNLHVPGESHFELWRAFAPEGLLRQAARAAGQGDWLAHEFGDGVLILAGTSAALTRCNS